MYKNDELLEMAQKLHDDFEEYRDMNEKLCKDIEILEGLESYFEFFKNDLE